MSVPPPRDTAPAPVMFRVALAAVTLAYAATAARHVLGGDNGEFATIGADGGVAHPPGYPLYVLYLRALAWLPAASPAHRASLATALLAALTVLALERACRAWGASPWGAGVAALLYATSPLAWRLGTSAEVFTLNALLAALILAVAAPPAPHAALNGARRVALLGLLAGLGLANHHTIVLLAPAGLCGAIAGVRESPSRLRASLAGVAALFVGLLPYAALVVAARAGGPTLRWGDTETFAGLIHHFLRADYGTLQLGVTGAAPEPALQLGVLGASFARQLLYVPVLLVIAGVVALLRRTSRIASVTLISAFLLAGPIFVMRFNLRPDGVAALVVERFHLLPLVVGSVFLALGATHLELRLGPRLAPSALARGALLASVPLIGATIAIPHVVAEHTPAVELYLRDTLASAPNGAVVLGTGDHRLFGFPYVQRALGERRDVVYVDPNLLHYAWYQRRVRGIFGFDPALPRGKSLDTRELIGNLIAKRYDVYVTDLFAAAVPRAFALYPIGTLIRVVPPGDAPPDPEALEAMNVAVFAKLHDSGPAHDPDSWAGLVREDYMRPWIALAIAFEQRGDGEAAERNRLRAAHWR